MDKRGLEEGWQALSQEVLSGMAEWRQQHPQASLRAIEQALDERLSRLRAKLLEDVALASQVRVWDSQSEQPPVCRQCGQPLAPRGEQERHLGTHGGREVVLKRTYGVCPVCGTGLFPPGPRT